MEAEEDEGPSPPDERTPEEKAEGLPEMSVLSETVKATIADLQVHNAR